MSTPFVGYSYSEMASGANHSRPTGMTYPNGRALTYTYAAGLDSNISRLSSLSDASDAGETYSYLGLGTVVRRSRGLSPTTAVEMTYVKHTGEADGEAGDQYAGLDRFGRVVDQRWRSYERSSSRDAGTAVDRFQYGYDRGGNVLYRENLIDAAFSELYHANGPSNGYDPLGQLTEFRRGALSDSNADGVPDSVAAASRSQSWDFDAAGNFEAVTTDGAAQARTHNGQNQATGVGAAALAYDGNGAMTTDEQGRTLKYDAWGRLVEVKQGTTVLASYGHDALGRRALEGGRTLYYSVVTLQGFLAVF